MLRLFVKLTNLRIVVNTYCGVYGIQAKKINSMGYIQGLDYPGDF